MAVILFEMRFAARVGLILLALGTARAEIGAAVDSRPPAPAKSAADSKPPISRRYEVREDSKTGRLVRVAARLKSSSKTSPRRTGKRALKRVVVQGSSAGSSKSLSIGQVDIEALVRQAGRRHNVDPRLIHAVIRQESNYDPFAVSAKGATGLMQLMPLTAARFGVQDIFDPAENVHGGVKYLRHLLDRYRGDHSLTLAAYNAGEGAVDRYGGIPPYEETTGYVGRVRRLYRSAGASVSSSKTGGDSGRPGRPRIVRRVEPSGLIRFETETE